MKANLLKITALSVLLITLLPLISAATPPPPLEGDPGVPIDGGASLLVGAAVVYGMKKLRNRKQTGPNDIIP
jgi:hypothetical protein